MSDALAMRGQPGSSAARRPYRRLPCLFPCRFICLFLLLSLYGSPSRPQALQLPSQPAAAFAPRPGARLPLDAVLRDERGAAIRLGSMFDSAPVVLVPGYYTCPNLCSTLFEGVLQALALGGMRPGAYRLVGFSIDPRDGAAAATARRAAYAAYVALLPGGAADVHMLTGDAAALARIETALGYRAVPDAATGELAHAAGFVVADARGRVTHYFSGVRFDPAALRAAVTAAGAHGGGAAPFGERLLMLCAHYDPALGLHTPAALAVVRAGALLSVLSIAGLGLWRWRGRAPHTVARPSDPGMAQRRRRPLDGHGPGPGRERRP